MMILSQYHIFELDTINIYSAAWEKPREPKCDPWSSMENLSGRLKLFFWKVFVILNILHICFYFDKNSIMRGIVLPNVCWIFSSIYTGGFLATVFAFWDWIVPLQDARVPCPQSRYIYCLPLLHKSELEWSSGQRRSFVSWWCAVESPCMQKTVSFMWGGGGGS